MHVVVCDSQHSGNVRSLATLPGLGVPPSPSDAPLISTLTTLITLTTATLTILQYHYILIDTDCDSVRRNVVFYLVSTNAAPVYGEGTAGRPNCEGGCSPVTGDS